jgi:hypothetical protein
MKTYIGRIQDTITTCRSAIHYGEMAYSALSNLSLSIKVHRSLSPQSIHHLLKPRYFIVYLLTQSLEIEESLRLLLSTPLIVPHTSDKRADVVVDVSRRGGDGGVVSGAFQYTPSPSFQQKSHKESSSYSGSSSSSDLALSSTICDPAHLHLSFQRCGKTISSTFSQTARSSCSRSR